MNDWKPPSIQDKPIAIVGVGETGRRVALSWVTGGFDVNIYDGSRYNGNATLAFISHNASAVIPPTTSKLGSVRIHEDIAAAVQSAWLVIEASTEKDDVRESLWKELVESCAVDTIFARASSIYEPHRLVEGRLVDTIQTRLLNMQYSLGPDCRLVELMSNGSTVPEVISFVADQLKQCGMMPSVVKKESTGFVMGRIWAAIQQETLSILAEGVSTPHEIDKAWGAWTTGTGIGPCRTMDVMGLENAALLEQEYAALSAPSPTTSDSKALTYLQEQYLSTGKTGKESRQGGLYLPESSHSTINLQQQKQQQQHQIQPAHRSEHFLTPLLYVLDLGTAVAHPSLHTGRVCLASPDGRSIQTLIPNQPRPDGIDISLATGKIYWTLMGTPGENDGLLRSCDIQGGESGDPSSSPVTDLVKLGTLNTPKQIAIDHVNSKLYFCDREGMKIWRCDLFPPSSSEDNSHDNNNASGLEMIVSAGDPTNPAHKHDQTRWCVGICVDPANKRFYWTQKGPSKGNQGRIFVAGMDMPAGETPDERSDIVCLMKGLPEPIDLELDEEEQVLWWTDRGDYPTGNSLNKAELKGIFEMLKKEADGTSAGKEGELLEKTVVGRHFHEAIGLKIDWRNLHIYLTDIGGEIYMMDIDGSNKRKIYDNEDAAFSGICLVHV